MTITSPRATGVAFPGVKPDNADEREHRRELARAVNGALQGKLNVLKTVTLTANAATTTITDARIGSTTAVILVPTTANAAAALATTYQTYGNATTGQAVLNHANNAQTDRTFVAVFFG